MAKIKLGIVEDHLLLRNVLVEFLSRKEDFEIKLDAGNMSELMVKLEGTVIDVLITDLYMPPPSVYESLKLLKDKNPSLKVMVLSMCLELDVISQLLDVGILAYISKADRVEVLEEAILTVSKNKIYRNSIYTDALYWDSANSKRNHRRKVIDSLSEREKEIIKLLWNEKSNIEIADQIYLSVRSVEKIRQDLKSKLGVRSTIGLIKYAIENGIISG